MKLIATAIVESERGILDADIAKQMIAVLFKGKGECIVLVNDEAVFSVSPHMYMLRIVGSEIVLYEEAADVAQRILLLEPSHRVANEWLRDYQRKNSVPLE